jgi:hypothetical protein
MVCFGASFRNGTSTLICINDPIIATAPNLQPPRYSNGGDFQRCVAALASPPPIDSIKARASNSAQVLRTFKEKLDQCDLRSIQQRKKPSKAEATARQKADGFIINGVTYLKNDRVEGWFPSSQDRSKLRKANIFRTKRKDTPTVDKKISGIRGKPRYYAINVEALDSLLAK